MADFSYDTAFKRCRFEDDVHVKTDRLWRVRVLTFEDSASLRERGVLEPIEPPAEVEQNAKAEKWSAALRLCGHEDRPIYAAAAASAGSMPLAFTAFTRRNSEGHMLPLPYWVSSGALQSVGFLTATFLGRTAPLWVGSLEIFVFRCDEEEEAPDLAAFLREELTGTSFPPHLLEKWQQDVVGWKEQLTERHHSRIDAARLISNGNGFLVRFDVGSLSRLLPGGMPAALEIYQKLADAAMEKCAGDGYPTCAFVQHLFVVLFAYAEKHFEERRKAFTMEGECEADAMMIKVLESACMLTMECFAENNVKRRMRRAQDAASLCADLS